MSLDANLAMLKEEVTEMLGDLDSALLELDKTPTDTELLNRAFRDIHTVKGACDMFGLKPMVAFAHKMESVFDRVRGGQIVFTRELLDLTFAAKDILLAMLDDLEAGADKRPEIIAGFERIMAGEQAAPEPAPLSPDPDVPRQAQPENPPEAPAGPQSFFIRFAPSAEDCLVTTDPLALIGELEALGQAHIFLDLSSIPVLGDLSPLRCYFAWQAVVTTDKGKNAVEDVFLFVDNPADVSIEAISAEEAASKAAGWAKEHAAAPTSALIPEPEPAPAPAAKPAPAAAPVVAPAAAPARPAAPPRPAAAEDDAAKKSPPPTPGIPRKEAQSLRVDASKLDSLVDLVGELVIAQSRLTQLAVTISHPGLITVAEEIERLSNDLRDNTLNIRMLPIGTTFSKFRRLVRDLSNEMKKEIDLVTEGAETELDKTVIEQLGDPLVHLLRNSIDHGIEAPDERRSKGKPAKGTILLSAEHAGGEVVIRIKDDGKGIDTVRVRDKAIERGLLSPDAKPSEQEIFAMIFAPGFSTAQKVTNVSGRGVGMDVVKRSIEQLRGKIDIQSARDMGSVITIRLPLTLAIIDGLMIKSGEEHYIIPLALVEECVEFAQTAVNGRKRTINLRGEIVPYVRLREAFEIPGELPVIEQIVITRSEGLRTGIAVDEVVGQLQTVIKSLGKVTGNVHGISGATIRADGTLALIIDVPGLITAYEHDTGAQ